MFNSHQTHQLFFMRINFEHIKGLTGEYFVILFYLFFGFRVIKHRYKNKLGEIDLILRRGRVIVFCEVKTRIGMLVDMNNVENIVTKNQMDRIIRSGINFMKNARYKGFEYRFDIALVSSFWKKPLIIKNIQ